MAQETFSPPEINSKVEKGDFKDDRGIHDVKFSPFRTVIFSPPERITQDFPFSKKLIKSEGITSSKELTVEKENSTLESAMFFCPRFKIPPLEQKAYSSLSVEKSKPKEGSTILHSKIR